MVKHETHDFVALDFETTGLNFYEPGFKVLSCSLTRSTDGESQFIMGHEEVRAALARLEYRQTPIATYNLAFELGVVTCCYPELQLNWWVDVQRLVQLYDNGGRGADQGFGLKSSVRRILGDYSNYEEHIYSWIRANVPGCRRGKEAQFISRLPRDLLEDYNIKDTEYTLKLYTHVAARFAAEGYDWQLDHELYMATVRLIVDAKIRGVRVNRDGIVESIISLQKDIEDIDTRFADQFEQEIRHVREELRILEQAKFKKKIVTEAPAFNLTSKRHLKMLFCDLLKYNIGFKTPGGSPSFKASHMALYGDGGKLLARRGKLLNWLNQAKALNDLSTSDGRWHPSLRAVGTATGRFAGGS